MSPPLYSCYLFACMTHLLIFFYFTLFIPYSLFASAPRPHVSPILGLLSDTFFRGGDQLHARQWSRSPISVNHSAPLCLLYGAAGALGPHDEVSTQDLIAVQMTGEQMRRISGIMFQSLEVFNHFICAKSASTRKKIDEAIISKIYCLSVSS